MSIWKIVKRKDGWNFKECKYISIEEYNDLYSLSDEVGRLVQYMIDNTGKFGAG